MASTELRLLSVLSSPSSVFTKRDFTMLSPSLIGSFAVLVLLSYFVLILGAATRNRRLRLGKKRSTPLPGFGLLGDRVNEFIGIFLDSLAIYVVDNKRDWDCPRRLLCEANQRAAHSGLFHAFTMYISSLFVSFWLKDSPVSKSMDAMKKGRMGHNCTMQYPCPFSL